jgi:hypothetical protein
MKCVGYGIRVNEIRGMGLHGNEMRGNNDAPKQPWEGLNILNQSLIPVIQPHSWFCLRWAFVATGTTHAYSH